MVAIVGLCIPQFAERRAGVPFAAFEQIYIQILRNSYIKLRTRLSRTRALSMQISTHKLPHILIANTHSHTLIHRPAVALHSGVDGKHGTMNTQPAMLMATVWKKKRTLPDEF